GLRNDYNAPRTLKTLQQLATSAAESASRIGALLLDDKFTHVPQEWVRIDPEPYMDEQPMRLRNALYGAPQPATALERYADLIPQHTLGALQRWITSDQFEHLRQEWDAIRKQRAEWADAPYPPVFVTVDAVVSCASHVLLIRRAQSPGKGLLALPGG